MQESPMLTSRTLRFRQVFAPLSSWSQSLTIIRCRLQAAKFIVPSVNTPIDYTSNEQLYFHTYEHSLPEGWRFPQMFRGNGTRSEL